MEIVHISYVFLAAGFLLMVLCIVRFRTNVRLSKGLISQGNARATLLSGFHQIVIMLFFLGYVIAFHYMQGNVHSTTIFYIGVIFFLGTVAVLLGVMLQSDMLSSIRFQHEEVVKINQQLVQAEKVMIFALAYQAELRDQETGKHLERTAHYVRLLAEKLAELPQYRSYMSPLYIEDLVKSAPLHDIGKVGIPDSILRKPGRLTPEEFKVIKQHCDYGTRVLKIADEKLDFQSFLKIAIQMVSSHHERWDGKGYPKGLKGDAIPVSGRIMALADVYDALRSNRCYKKEFSHEETCHIVLSEVGKQFDPDLLDVFKKLEKQFHRISVTMGD